jgi:hypothetical protein
MTTIKQIFERFGPQYQSRFGHKMPYVHQKTIAAIVNCRSGHYGLTIYQCSACGKYHHVHRCCGNRHCPNCQHQKSRQWLDRQMNRRLCGQHFLVTFTVPEQLRAFIRSHQRIGYAAMFAASSQTLKKLAADEKYIGGDLPGFLGVLHTWGRQLQYHPHIHYVVAGGALSKNDQSWHPSQRAFFLPVKAMSKIYAAKFRDQIIAAGLYDLIPADVWQTNWVVNCKAVGCSTASLKYLSAYVFKVAISDSRIVKVENGRVFFRYRKSKSNRLRTICLDAAEFIRRFLQHVLPTGFMKIRYYGFLSPKCPLSLEKINALIQFTSGFALKEPEKQPESVFQPTCSHCGGLLKYLASLLPYQMAPKPSG